MADSSAPGGSPIDSLSSRIIEEFERAWLAGRPAAGDYLARHAERPAALARELAAIDIENRFKHGEPADAADYLPLLADAQAPDDYVGDLRLVADRFRSRYHAPEMTTGLEEAAVPRGDRSGDGPEAIAAGGRLAHYRIVRAVGRGAFGTVWEAFDEKLHRRVALKLLGPEWAATVAARQRFVREARAMAAVTHENVVRVYAVEEEPTPFLAMEFVDGSTLQARLDEDGPLVTAEVVRIAHQIAAALAAAHDTGLIHRDVKPANVLMERGAEGRVKLTDFGLARASDDAGMTRTGTIVGTPMYMAPEQALGETVDHRADLFSLGSVMYAMACGRTPFGAPSTVAVLRRVVDEAPEPIPVLRPDTPPWLVDLIARLHRKQPADRIQSAREVVRLLARAAADPATMDGAVPPAGPVLRPAGPPPAGSSAAGKPAAKPLAGRLAAAATMLAIAAGIAVAVWLRVGVPAVPPKPTSGAVAVRAPVEPPPSPEPPPPEPPPEKSPAPDSTAAAPAAAVATPGLALAPGMPRSPGWEPGPPLQGLPGIVTNPTILPGIARWQVIRRVPTFHVTSVDWSRRGRIAVAADDGLVRVYDAATMRLERVFGPHGRPDPERSQPVVRWSPDGGLLATDGMGLHVWNADTGAEVVFVSSAEGNPRIAWHPSGRKLAVTAVGRNNVRLVTLPSEGSGTLPTNETFFSCGGPDVPLGKVLNIAWSPDGSRLACVGEPAATADPTAAGTLVAVLVTEGGVIDRVVRGAADARRASTWQAAWSPDGGRLALAGFDGGTCFVDVCSIGTATATTLLDSGTYGPHVSSLAWHPDGHTLFCGFLNDTRRLTFDGSTPTRFPASGLAPTADRRFVLDPAGSLAITTEQESSGLRIYRTADGTVAWSAGAAVGASTLRWLADGRMLLVSGNPAAGRVVGSRGEVVAGPWPLALPEGLGQVDVVAHPRAGGIFAVRRDTVTNVFDTDGTRLAGFDGPASRLLPAWVTPEADLGLLTDSGELRLLDERYRTRATLPMPVAAWTHGWVARVSVGGSDRRRIAYPTAPDGVPGIFTIDPAAGGQATVEPLPPGLREPGAIQVELDRSGDWAAARHRGSRHPTACRLSDGRTEVFRGHTSVVDDIDWSPTGATLHSAGFDGRSFAWRPESGETRLFELANAWFRSVAADPATGLVAVETAAQDVHCLEPETLEPRWSLAVLPGDGHATFSPGGRLLGGDITAVDDHLVYVVDREDGPRRLLAHKEFLAVADEARRAIRPDAATAGLLPEEVEAGFRRLTRNDWYVHDRPRLGNVWRIGDDGVSAVQMHRDGLPNVWTRERYRDFELRCDVRLESGQRSARTAICFATPLPEWESWLALGFVRISLVGDGFIRTHGPGEEPPAVSIARPGLVRKNDWNTVRLRVDGGSASVVLNGEPVRTLELPEPFHGRDCPLSLQFPALGDENFGESGADPFEPGLARCEFRNIRIRRLDADVGGTQAQ